MQHNGTQSSFAAALLARRAPPPVLRLAGAGDSLGRRFDIHRINVFASLCGVLAARFPAVSGLVGEEFFRGMASEFVAAHPPESPVLLEYGGGFAPFIRQFGPARDLPYLGDVAAFEWALHEASHAADAAPVALGALATIDAAHLSDVKMTLHPAARVFASSYPAVSLWRVNTGDEPLPKELSGPENALIARPEWSVTVHDLKPGTSAFLKAIAAGSALGDSVAAAQRIEPGFDLAGTLALVFTVGAIAAVTLP